MDNLRGLDSHSSPLDDMGGDYLIDEAEDAGLERPPPIASDERRMQVRAYNFWTRMLDEHDFPLVENLDPQEAMDFGDYSVLLDFSEGLDHPRIAHVGKAIADESGLDGPIERLEDVHPRSMLSRITDHYMQIHANKAPIGFEAEFVNQRESTILYRGILLPFSSTGDEIDYIYGVINWKEAVDGPEADKLNREVSEALDSVGGEAVLPAWTGGAPVDDDLSVLTNDDGIIDAFVQEDGDTTDTLDLADHIYTDPGPDDGLHDWLNAARLAADAADLAERRSRQALYDAIGRTYDFSIVAEREPESCAELLEDAGLVRQERAPHTPLVKLVFGANYDKSRVAEIATVIGYARKEGVGFGECAEWITNFDGGLKAIVKTARAMRRPLCEVASLADSNAVTDRHATLRMMPARALSDFSGDGGEFVLLVGRRNAAGEVELIGALEDERDLTEKVINKMVN